MILEDKKFTHCLRAQIFPDKNADERIKSILKFALKYNFKNVILMFNAEEFNTGHATIEELKPWMDVILRAKNVLAENGISTSLNPWIEFGHLDRGRKLKPGQNFNTMVDKNGKHTELVACPLDENWRKFYLEKLEYYISIIKPEFLWIEDDFRLHNHAPLEWGGCFCEEHLRLINNRLNSNLSRQEIVNGIINDKKIRQAWLEVSFETLDSLAKLISLTVKKASPKTEVALMSSMPECHQMEGRHWNELLKDLSTSNSKIDRIHIPYSHEMSFTNFMYYYNGNSMVVRSFIDDDAYIYPELENCVFCNFANSPKSTKFKVENSLSLGIQGITYDIFDFIGNGAQEELNYGKSLLEISPYLDAVKELNLKPSQLRGLTFPIDEMAVLNRKSTCWEELIPDEHKGVSIFSSLGYSFSLKNQKIFKDETIVLTSQTVNYFSDTELKNLFKDNFIILDGESAKHIIDRNLGSLINASSYKEIKADSGVVTYEMMNKSYKGMHGYKGSLERNTGDYILIKYDSKVDTYSSAYDYNNKKIGPSVVKYKNVLINPFIYRKLDYSTFGTLKDELFIKLIETKSPLIKTTNQGIYSYFYAREANNVIFLSNTYDDLSNINLLIYNLKVNRIIEINRNGERKEVRFSLKKNKLTIFSKFSYLSTKTFIIE